MIAPTYSDGTPNPDAPPADQHGNRIAREGCDRCACGSKYWENDRCVDCRAHVTAPGVDRGEPAEVPASLPPAGPVREHSSIHCHTCDHPVNVRRAGVCVAAGHVVSVVQIHVMTINAPHARPFTATPAPYLGTSR
jgi:hypothetical protein